MTERTLPRRLLLYAHFDPQGGLDPHVLYQVRALSDFGARIVFISNSPLTEQDKDLLAPVTAKIRERPDEGYDWTAWKEALLELGPENASLWDEIILMNDSTYGPLFPLEEMFSAMDETGVDFWGITRDGHPYYGEHLQPYFCVFRPRMFTSPEFWNFWRHLPEMRGFTDALNHGELAMTRRFNEAGFLHGAFADLHLPRLTPAVGPMEPLVYTAAQWLISRYRAPFIKIKAFSTWPGKQFNTGTEFFDALEKSGSPYPPRLIEDHLTRTRPLSWQKNLRGFLNSLPVEGALPPDPGLKIAVFAHLFYEDQFEEALGWLARIPYRFDVYFSTSSGHKRDLLRALLARTPRLNTARTDIRIFEDRGRDVAPWLFGFNDVQQDYDLALKFHLKKRMHLNPVFTDAWSEFILTATLASPVYISRVIQLFSGRKDLGLAFHPIPPALLLYHHAYDGSELDRLAFETVLRACGIRTPVETSYPLFPQNIFWYRPAALKALFQSSLSLADFPEEPFPPFGTIAHGLERAVAYVAVAARYRVCQIIPEPLLLRSFQHYEDHLWHLGEAERQKDDDRKTFSHWHTNAWDLAPMDNQG